MSKEIFSSVTSSVKDSLRRPIETRTGMIPRNERLHRVSDAIGHVLTRELTVNGIEQIQRVKELSEEGKRIVFATRHEAHLDAVALDQSLEQAGYQDLADKIFHMFGIRLEKGVFSSWFSESQNRIRLWPPYDAPQNDEEKELRRTLGKTAPVAMREALDQNYLVNIFPEGTRAKEHRKMMCPLSSVTTLFEQTGVEIVVPVAINGTQNILPRGGMPRRGSYSVTFCEPIDFPSLLATHQDKQFKSLRQAVIDDIMRPIADVLPEEYRGYFADHTE